ncbi:MAG: hypothetical protein K2H64_12060 [Desulfovibrio sp.]|nr:hypothetical protein [Desulfovibrio sp.]
MDEDFSNPPWYDVELEREVGDGIHDAYGLLCAALAKRARKKGAVVSPAPFALSISDELDVEGCYFRAIAFPDIRLLPNFAGPDLIGPLLKKYKCENPRDQLAFSAAFFEKIPPFIWSPSYPARALRKAFGAREKVVPTEKDLENMRSGWQARCELDIWHGFSFPLRLEAIFDDSPTIAAVWDIDYGRFVSPEIEIRVAAFEKEVFARELARVALEWSPSFNFPAND